jgi:hypothetical protein
MLGYRDDSTKQRKQNNFKERNQINNSFFSAYRHHINKQGIVFALRTPKNTRYGIQCVKTLFPRLFHRACTKASSLIILPICENQNPMVLWPEADPLCSLTVFNVYRNIQYRYLCQDAIGQKKAISHLFAITRDSRNEARKKSSAQGRLCNI